MSFDSWCLLHLDAIARRLAAHYQAHMRVMILADRRERQGVWIVDEEWE